MGFLTDGTQPKPSEIQEFLGDVQRGVNKKLREKIVESFPKGDIRARGVRQRAISEAGLLPTKQEQDLADLQALQRSTTPVLDKLLRPNFAVAGAIEEFAEGLGAKAATKRAFSEIFSGLPFTNIKGQKKLFKNVFEDTGIIEKTHLSDAEVPLPFTDKTISLDALFSETGKGLKLKKGGVFDLTDTGTLGFAADVGLDPITYLTFGTSGFIKHSGKTLSKKGSKAVARKVERKRKELDAKGVSIGQKTRIKELKKAADNEAERQIKMGRIEKGGVKFAGQTLIPGETVKKVFNSKGAKLLKEAAAETKAGKFAAKAKETFTESFITDFKVPQKASAIIDSANRKLKQARPGIMDRIEKRFKGVSKTQKEEFTAKILELKNAEFIEREAMKKQFLASQKENIKNVGKLLNEVSMVDRKLLKLKTLRGLNNLRTKKTELLIKIKNNLPEELVNRGVPEKLDAIIARHGQGAIVDARNFLQNELRATLASGKLKKKTEVKAVLEAKKKFSRVRPTSEDQTVQELFDFFVGKPGQQGEFSKLFRGRQGKIPFENYIKTLPEVKAAEKKALNFGRKLTVKNLKRFKGSDIDKAVKDPVKLILDEALFAAQNRINSDALKSIAKNYGIKASKKQIKELDLVPFTRKLPDGTNIDTFIPRRVRDAFAKFEVNDIPLTAEMLGQFNSLFKASVTTYFPQFHFRNAQSNYLLAFSGPLGIKAFNPRTFKQVTEGFIREKSLSNTIIKGKTGKEFTLSKLLQIAKREGIIDQGFFMRDIEDFLTVASSTRGQRIAKATNKFNPLSIENGLFTAGRKVGSKIEDHARFSAFVNAIKAGSSISAARKITLDSLFDYGKLTPFERKWMRTLIPFYTFSRKNFELQLRALGKTPGKITTQAKAIAQTRELKPEFLQEQFAFDLGENKEGLPEILLGVDLPISQALETGEQLLELPFTPAEVRRGKLPKILSQFTPAIKFFVERAANFDSFRQRDIDSIKGGKDIKAITDILRLTGAEETAKKIEEFVQLRPVTKNIFREGKRTGETRITWEADPVWLHLLRNLTTSRLQSTIGFLSAEDKSMIENVIRGATGLRIADFDKFNAVFWNKRKLSTFLEKEALRKGVRRFQILSPDKRVPKKLRREQKELLKQRKQLFK